MYWFAIPNIGSILKGLSQVQKQFIYIIRIVGFLVIGQSKILVIISVFVIFKIIINNYSLLIQGRKELLSLLNRQRYKEMMLAPLEKKRLRLSLLDMRFHLRDLIGSGHLKTVNTPTGLLVRVSKD